MKKEVLTKWYVWAIIGIPAAIVILWIALSRAEPHMPPKRTVVTAQAAASSSTAFTAEDGVVVIKAPQQETAPVQSAEPEGQPQYTMPSEVMLPNKSIGRLNIPKLKLMVDVFESEDQMEDMAFGAAHFKSTSSWNGNVGLSAHNVNFDGSRGYFYDIHRLQAGDEVKYTSLPGERTYQVTLVEEIPANDWTYLKRTQDNRLTLITCISNQPDKRLVVQAVES